MAKIASSLLELTRQLSDELGQLRFKPPVAQVYNPLDYAWEMHAEYIRRFAATPKQALFLGMNPGPFGMVQTGIPFGEVAAVRDWMGLEDKVQPPVFQHPKRPVEGFACPRSEVSGRRLWGLFAEIRGSPEAFFADHFVFNYCPLAFLRETGANLTPDQLPADERKPVEAACDRTLAKMIEILQPAVVVGIGVFARKCLERILKDRNDPVKIGTLLHPSPASPIANREWPEKPRRQLKELGILSP